MRRTHGTLGTHTNTKDRTFRDKKGMTNEYNKERNTQAKRETTKTLRRLDKTEITSRELSFFQSILVVRFIIGRSRMLLGWVLISWLFV